MANRQEHIIVFTLSTLLFLIGISTGIILSRNQMSDIQEQITDFEDNINSMELSVLINDALKNETLSCKYLQGKLNETNQLLLKLGEKAVDYEEQAKIKDEEYKEIKKEYNYVRTQYWLMLEQLRNQCSNNYTTLLFFYRTLTPCPECRDQGVILSHLSVKNEGIYVVPVDADEELLIVDLIKEAYQVNQTPSIIINGAEKITGLVNSNELLKSITTNS